MIFISALSGRSPGTEGLKSGGKTATLQIRVNEVAHVSQSRSLYQAPANGKNQGWPL
jgi:hypothetical protein